MPNIAAVLKSEISRVSRKEVRGETLGLKKTASACRSDIAALRRRILALEQQLRQLIKATAKDNPSAPADGAEGGRRFSAKGLASQRRRLGLSAADCGLLIGTSGQTIYNWEQGKARPRSSHLPALDALKSVGKKVIAARLAELKTGP
ncbi:MAG: hypothetical protein M3Z15_00100 [Pseudomonadota bacterium]|nr:hypothetical protein [Pseudomonadota bacterium]